MKKPLQPPCGRRKCNPPLVAGATTFPPLRGGTTTRAYCRDAYEENVSRCFILPPEQGEVRRSRKGGGERSEPISRMPIMLYDAESKSRNADFMLIACKGDTTTLGPKGRQTYEPSGPWGRSILRTFFHNPSTQPAAPAAPLFIKLAAKPPPQPSARRAVKLKNLKNLRGAAPSNLTPQAFQIRK